MPWKHRIFVLTAAAISIGVIALYWNVAVKPPVSRSSEKERAAPAPMTEPFVTVVDPAKGAASPKVTIVEFGDHACPYCRSSQEAVDRLIAEHPNEVRFVWKSAPSPMHPGSDTAAKAALCAARQGKFWEYHAALFANPGTFDQASMAILANDLGLEPTRFNECLTQDATLPLVERTVIEAQALGVTAIPTVFIGGTRYEGALSYDQLLKAAGF